MEQLNEVDITMSSMMRQINQNANEVDYQHAEGATLLSDHVEARRQLDVLGTNFEFLSQLRNNADLMKQAGEWESYIEEVQRVRDLFIYYAALAEGTAVEIFRRANRNGTNRNFALFKFGIDRGIVLLQNDSYRQLQKIAHGISWKRDWHHPDGQDEWNSKRNEVLVRELAKYNELSPSATLAAMLDNRFSYIHEAFKNGFIDEWRRVYCRPDLLDSHRGDMEENRGVLLSPLLEADRRERLATIKLIELAGDSCDLSGGKEILHQVALILGRDPDSLSEMSERQIRAQLVKAIARIKGVSHEQARKDLRNLKAAKDIPLLSSLRSTLRGAALLQVQGIGEFGGRSGEPHYDMYENWPE